MLCHNVLQPNTNRKYRAGANRLEFFRPCFAKRSSSSVMAPPAWSISCDTESAGKSLGEWSNTLVSQMRAPLAACREPAGKLWQLYNRLHVFEHKKQYLLIHALFTRIVVFYQIGNVPPMTL